MPNRIPQSVALRVPLKAYLSDGITDAPGKTIAIVISKNGGAFGNPSAGATNATEIANGWYYVDLSTTDTGSLGPLIIRGTATGVDNTEIVYDVVNAFNAGFTGIPGVTAEGAGGLYTRGTGAGQINQPANGLIDVNTLRWNGTAVATPATAGIPDVNVKNIDNDAASASGTVTFPNATLASTTNITAGTITTVTTVTNDVGITQAGADKVWLSAARTLTSFGTLVADVATAVWAAASRTLTSFGTLTADVADKLLGRNLAGGSDGGRTVQDALRILRNKRSITAGTLTVTIEDDVTPAWTAAVTTAVSNPVNNIDPA